MFEFLFIIGRSEIVNNSLLTKISELFYTLGINNTNPTFCPTYTMSVDYALNAINNIVINKLDTTLLISWNNIELLRDDIKYKIFEYKTVGSECKTPYTHNILHYCGFTHDVAVSFGIQQGFKNIVLVGAADFTNIHYDNSKPFIYSKRLMEQSKYFLEKVCTQYCNLYTFNPESKLNIPRITLEEVISKVYGKR